MVALLSDSPLAVLNRLVRAPLDTGKTLFAPVLPDGLAFRQDNVLRRADFYAVTASRTLFIRQEGLIHFTDIVDARFAVYPGKKWILPEGPLLHRQLFAVSDKRCNFFYQLFKTPRQISSAVFHVESPHSLRII